MIMFNSDEDEEERGVLDIKNCRLKKHNFKDTNLKYLYGFIIMAKGKTIDFYVDTVEERERASTERRERWIHSCHWRFESSLSTKVEDGSHRL